MVIKLMTEWYTVTKPHRIQTGQHHSNLPVGICGNGGEGIPHDGEERPTPCHHLLNERKVTPLALPCNHGDGDTVSICTKTGISCSATPGDILTTPTSAIPGDILTTPTSPFDSYPESRWFLLVLEQPSSSQNMASQTDTWQDLWENTIYHTTIAGIH